MPTNLNPDDPQLYKHLEPLKTIDSYRQYFMDADYWRTCVQIICQRHQLTPCQTIRTGLPGCYPTFIVDDRRVVKFFGQLFDGALAFEAEREVNQLISLSSLISAPALITTGHFFETTENMADTANAVDCSWPYLIFAFMPGVSIGEVYDQVSTADKLVLAQMLGEATHRLHHLSPATLSAPQLTWEAYVNLIREQHTGWQKVSPTWEHVPGHLKEQIGAFLLPLDSLIGQGVSPQLIHADLTADHILGDLEDGRWTTNGMIDFGDAMVADFVYELIALHLDLFRCDKGLLAAYLAAYGLDVFDKIKFQQTLPNKAMTLTILHRFDVLDYMFKTYPHLNQVSTFEQLATLLWDVNAPGLND